MSRKIPPVHIGDKFGKRTIRSRPYTRLSYNNYERYFVIVQCECGKEDEVEVAALIRNKVNSCRSCATALIFDVGTRFGKREVIGQGGKNNQGQRKSIVRCDCGSIDEVINQSLKKGIANRCRQCLPHRYKLLCSRCKNELTVDEQTLK